jgi:hypothetical protein
MDEAGDDDDDEEEEADAEEEEEEEEEEAEGESYTDPIAGSFSSEEEDEKKKKKTTKKKKKKKTDDDHRVTVNEFLTGRASSQPIGIRLEAPPGDPDALKRRKSQRDKTRSDSSSHSMGVDLLGTVSASSPRDSTLSFGSFGDGFCPPGSTPLLLPLPPLNTLDPFSSSGITDSGLIAPPKAAFATPPAVVSRPFSNSDATNYSVPPGTPNIGNPFADFHLK